MKRILLLFLLTILFSGTESYSQDVAPDAGVMYGVVSDSAGIPLAAVVIKLKGTYFGAVSEADGTYRVETLHRETIQFRLMQKALKQLNTQISLFSRMIIKNLTSS